MQTLNYRFTVHQSLQKDKILCNNNMRKSHNDQYMTNSQISNCVPDVAKCHPHDLTSDAIEYNNNNNSHTFAKHNFMHVDSVTSWTMDIIQESCSLSVPPYDVILTLLFVANDVTPSPIRCR
jgi:hypothetical protein